MNTNGKNLYGKAGLITVLVIGMISGGAIMFYFQKAECHKRITLIAAETASLLVMPLESLQAGDQASAIHVLEDYLNKVILIALNKNSDVLKKRISHLLMARDYRDKYNCRLADNIQEKKISDIFKQLEEYREKEPDNNQTRTIKIISSDQKKSSNRK